MLAKSIFRRELSSDSPRGPNGVHRACSTSLVHRLERVGTLEGHDGCVNTVAFSPDGGTLLSGSDDLKVIFWDWQRGCQRLSYESGHHGNVFQARAMPGSNLHVVISCAADGQVRVGHVKADGAVETRKLASHQGRAHKLALDPGQGASFYSCGEDGAVRHFDLREPGVASRKLLLCRASRHGQVGKKIELNSIACNSLRPWQFAVGGGDEYVRIYDQRRTDSGGATSSLGRQSANMALPVRKLAPKHLRQSRRSKHITCATFSASGEVLTTYNDENMYLFEAEGPAAAVRLGGGHRQAIPAKRRRSAGGSEARADAGDKLSRTSNHQPARLSDSQEPLLPPPPPPGSPPRASEPGPSRDPDPAEDADAASAAAQRQRSTPAAASAGGSEERGAEGNEETEPAASRTRDAAVQREPGSPYLRFEVALPAGEHNRDDVQVRIQDAMVRALGQRAPRHQDETTARRQEPRDSEEISEAQRRTAQLRRQRRNAFFIPSAVGGLDSDSEGDEEEDLDGEMAGAGSFRGGSHGEDDDGKPDHVLMCYRGHRNAQTVKGCAFAGAGDELVMSGSDCGHLFIWDKLTGRLQQFLEGDQQVVNCLESHPFLPLTIATSGIDDDIKLWAPTATEPNPPGQAAQAAMDINRRRQGRARGPGPQIVLTPHMLAQLLRLHHPAFGTQATGTRTNAEESERRGDSPSDEEASERGTSEEEERRDGPDCVIM